VCSTKQLLRYEQNLILQCKKKKKKHKWRKNNNMEKRRRYQKRKLWKSPKTERMLQNISYWVENSAPKHFSLSSNEWRTHIGLWIASSICPMQMPIILGEEQISDNKRE